MTLIQLPAPFLPLTVFEAGREISHPPLLIHSLLSSQEFSYQNPELPHLCSSPFLQFCDANGLEQRHPDNPTPLLGNSHVQAILSDALSRISMRWWLPSLSYPAESLSVSIRVTFLCRFSLRWGSVTPQVEAGETSKYVIHKEQLYYLSGKDEEIKLRLYIPKGLRAKILEQYHKRMGRIVIDKTCVLVGRTYYWSGV